MPKSCRVKVSTRKYRKRKVFNGDKSKVVNNDAVNIAPVNAINVESNSSVNIEVPFVNNVNNESNLNNSAQSAASLKVLNIDAVTPSKVKTITGYRIIDMTILSGIFNEFQCPICEHTTLSLIEDAKQKKGLSACLFIKCDKCNYRKEFYTSSRVKGGKSSFDINRRTVYTMRTLGHGHAGIENFCTLMNMPKPMTQNNYDKLVLAISAATKEIAEQTMLDAANDLREHNGALETDIVDIDASSDGSWQRKGFSSLNGVVTVISVETGKFLDVEPMNRTCKPCSLKADLKRTDPDAYAEWRNSHICKFNYQGSAGGMEPEGAKRIFERSLKKYNIRYTKFLGDGDSKSFSTVKDTYPGIEVQKLECVGHYQKRIGNRLRKLKKKEKGLGGRGKLTDATIDRLQNYFGVAIRQNAGDLAGMVKATRASLFHVSSSKNNNFHYPNCPTGSNSWCKYNADKANGTNTYKPGPGLPLDIIHKLRPVYVELTQEKELQKCLHGKTQNANESFNAKIWDRIPKNNYVSLDNLKFGVYDAVGNYNIGMKSTVLIFEKLEMIPGAYTSRGCKYINRKRLCFSAYQNDQAKKLKKKEVTGKKTKKK